MRSDNDEVREAPVPDRPDFVLHDHRVPRPHVDLRLAEGGVLRSWAVPRGMPGPGQNRLAVSVPDHDLDHLRYTDADKSIADLGWWEEHDRNDRRMVFTLHGRSASVRYVLVHTGGVNWLLRRTSEQPGPQPQDRAPRPVRRAAEGVGPGADTSAAPGGPAGRP